MTYRLFDEMDYLKRRLESCASEMRHIQARIEIVEQSLFSSLTEVDGLPVLVAHIIYQASIEYNVSIDEMRSGSEARRTDLLAAKNLSIFRISELGRWRMGEIAKWFNISTATATAAKVKGKLIAASKKAKT